LSTVAPRSAVLLCSAGPDRTKLPSAALLLQCPAEIDMTNTIARKPDETAIPYQHSQPQDMSPDIVHPGVLDVWLGDDEL
jgi:hypothetical protein